MRIRTNDRARCDACIFHDASGAHHDAVADLGILDHAVRANSAITANPRVTENLHEGFNYGVGADLHFSIDHAGLGIIDAHAVCHQLLILQRAQAAIDLHQFGASV